MTSHLERPGLDQASPPEIEREIDVTRSAIRDDLRSLGEKISPEHLKEEAVGVIKGAASSARESVSQGIERAEARVQQASTRSLRRIKIQAQRARETPLALAGGGLILGLGIGLLMPVTQPESRLLGSAPLRVREQAREVLQEGREAAERLREGAREAASDAKEAFQEPSRHT